jgi:hypothetical protein
MSGHVMSRSYNQNSEPQLQSNLRNKEHLLTYLRLAAQLARSQLNIGDFGCSGGRNSFIVFKEVLTIFREESSIPISITHEDQPNNSWEEFFKAFAEVGYGDIKNVNSYVAGKSFYEQVFPDNFLQLAYCNSALHYARKIIPCPDHSSPFLSSVPEIRDQARRNGRADLKELLEIRARELAPGGFFIINCLFQSSNFVENLNLRNEFNRLLVKEGFLTEEEFERLLSPIYPYSIEDWHEVLHSLSHLYMIRHFEILNRVNPIYQRYLETHDEDTYLREMNGFVRGWFEHSLRKCLIREEKEKDQVIEEYFERHKEYIRNREWGNSGNRILVILQVIKKE